MAYAKFRGRRPTAAPLTYPAPPEDPMAVPGPMGTPDRRVGPYDPWAGVSDVWGPGMEEEFAQTPSGRRIAEQSEASALEKSLAERAPRFTELTATRQVEGQGKDGSPQHWRRDWGRAGELSEPSANDPVADVGATDEAGRPTGRISTGVVMPPSASVGGQERRPSMPGGLWDYQAPPFAVKRIMGLAEQHGLPGFTEADANEAYRVAGERVKLAQRRGEVMSREQAVDQVLGLVRRVVSEQSTTKTVDPETGAETVKTTTGERPVVEGPGTPAAAADVPRGPAKVTPRALEAAKPDVAQTTGIAGEGGAIEPRNVKDAPTEELDALREQIIADIAEIPAGLRKAAYARALMRELNEAYEQTPMADQAGVFGASGAVERRRKLNEIMNTIMNLGLGIDVSKNRAAVAERGKRGSFGEGR